MSAATQVSLAEYLSTSYEPDCEYIDGVLEERNVGKRKHGETQALLCAFLLSLKLKDYRVIAEQRTQVTSSRVRIPDVCLIKREDTEDVAQHPPILCVEILSPDDRWVRFQDRVRDYLAFGVRTIWIIDPEERGAWIATPASGVVGVGEGILRCSDPKIEVALKDILPDEGRPI